MHYMELKQVHQIIRERMAIPKFNIPNLCGASPELNNALSKIADLKDSINVNINLDASADRNH